ncbi:hypothetical protein IWX88_002664 [Frigoribacterium sp. CG_9.8]|nr:hypothetical protein [Frigoribacterium sp. CG_9.8]
MPAILLPEQMMASGGGGGPAPNKRVVGDPYVKLTLNRAADRYTA